MTFVPKRFFLCIILLSAGTILSSRAQGPDDPAGAIVLAIGDAPVPPAARALAIEAMAQARRRIPSLGLDPAGMAVAAKAAVSVAAYAALECLATAHQPEFERRLAINLWALAESGAKAEGVAQGRNAAIDVLGAQGKSCAGEFPWR